MKKNVISLLFIIPLLFMAHLIWSWALPSDGDNTGIAVFALIIAPFLVMALRKQQHPLGATLRRRGNFV